MTKRTSEVARSERVSAKSLAESLFGMGALRLGDFVLPNGKRSPYDLDLRLVPSYPDLYTTVLAAYVELVDGVGSDKFDCIAGVVTAGVTISSPLAVMLKKPMMYVRKPGEGRDTDKFVEGFSRRGARVLVIDDLVSTGASVSAAAAALRRKGFVVTDSVVLVDRLEGGRANLASEGIKLNSYCSIADLLLGLEKSGIIDRSRIKAILDSADTLRKKSGRGARRP
ncbi:MAG TPA: phosphoribosyltransferase family protein [Nitrososphaerales archaeon]|nr:phosphoribosyltransferase family protein [Nitrososphaerales archaeon]